VSGPAERWTAQRRADFAADLLRAESELSELVRLADPAVAAAGRARS
jgi:hypothetical protein